MEKISKILMGIVAILAFSMVSLGQTTAFTYQGHLTDGGSPANGSFQMQFKLFDSLAGGSQVGPTIADLPVTAAQGIFSARLDFGSNALSGANRWLEIAVRHNAGEGYTTLTPREQVNSSPYSVRTLSAASSDGLSSACAACVQDAQINSISGNKVTGNVASATNASTATNATQLGGVPAGQYVQTSDPRLSDARNPLPGSNSYIQNSAAVQAANQNISGNAYFGGNVGIGTTTPASKLGIQTASNQYGFTQTNGTVSVGSYVDPVAGWLGTRSNHPLNFFTNDSVAQVTLSTNGNLGVGLTSPASKVDIAAQDGLRITGFQPFITLRDANAGNALGYIQNVGGNLTVLNSNLSQNPAATGLLKFGILVNADGSLNVCYNAQNPTLCGVTVSHPSTGQYDITFPVQINSRPINTSVALEPNFFFALTVIGVRPTSQQSIRVNTVNSNSGTFRDEPFYLTVF